nr:MAG TPA: hypothetical protein [Caudoviricetes sp.]
MILRCPAPAAIKGGTCNRYSLVNRLSATVTGYQVISIMSSAESENRFPMQQIP